VGEASGTMEYLRQRGLDEVILQLSQPVLGICLGMQLMCKYSEEGTTDCLNIFDAEVLKFQSGKVPHMGWNSLEQFRGPLFRGLSEASYVYFVHSYYVPLTAILQLQAFTGRAFLPLCKKIIILQPSSILRNQAVLGKLFSEIL
jgi:imidazole glycerol-phosphate synthase subunit HisH